MSDPMIEHYEKCFQEVTRYMHQALDYAFELEELRIQIKEQIALAQIRPRPYSGFMGYIKNLIK